MTYTYASSDGLCRSNDAEFIHRWNESGKNHIERRRSWKNEMAIKGCRIAMADDGWVDRVRNTVSPPTYADMHMECLPGDLIALGGPDKWRIVRCLAVAWNNLMSPPFPVYQFDPDAVEVGPCQS